MQRVNVSEARTRSTNPRPDAQKPRTEQCALDQSNIRFSMEYSHVPSKHTYDQFTFEDKALYNPEIS